MNALTAFYDGWDWDFIANIWESHVLQWNLEEKITYRDCNILSFSLYLGFIRGFPVNVKNWNIFKTRFFSFTFLANRYFSLSC